MQNVQKERLSLAYIAAVTGRLGYDMIEWNVDLYGCDGTITSGEGTFLKLDFQAKSTSRDVLRDDHVAFDLPVKNYNDLRKRRSNSIILAVLVLPNDEAEWLSHSEEALIMRRCAYWMSLKGYPDSANTSSVTVQIPRRQVFDTTQVQQLMRSLEQDPVL